MTRLQPWYWRSLPLAGRSGAEVFAQLFLTSNIATLLESPSASPLARYSICAGPPRQVKGVWQVWTPAIGSILPCLKQLLKTASPGQADQSCLPADLPFTGGWLGWLGYDLAWEIERLPWLSPDPLPFPVSYWYEPASFAVLDHQEQCLWLAASQPDQLDQLQDALEANPQAIISIANHERKIFQPRFCTDQIDYEAAVLKAKAHIQAGDIFQANLSLRFQAAGRVNSWQLYQALQKINPSPFASYWQTAWGSVVSCSPERLVSVQGKQVQTRPIAGTRGRGSSPEQDQRLAQDLLANAKEQAEHTMLVDLERNDLGRVCAWGSVQVDELLTIEYYSHVMHLVSNVVGTLQDKQDAIDVIQSLFPGGTITGCPKVRCMEIIEELEPVRRSLFYGSCGYLDQRGDLDLNILIRTLLVVPELVVPTDFKPAKQLAAATIWGQVGAGIVADSQPEQEWHESLQKAQAQIDALQQIIC
ncbi:MAG: anthranilate synthase component I [Aphanocapsa sp. GSE-SYN-MK-11-07L]|nr:anthranilate synthase component I [Aphanocapsa sp. GSE-SYN-MK-11-07L]